MADMDEALAALQELDGPLSPDERRRAHCWLLGSLSVLAPGTLMEAIEIWKATHA